MTRDEKLHIKANLIPTEGENGEMEWIGTDVNWNEYERLVNELECQNIDYKEPF